MRSHEEKSMNYEHARVLAIRAANNYLAGRGGHEGDRYGQYHGEKGRWRAQHVKEYLLYLAKNTANKT